MTLRANGIADQQIQTVQKEPALWAILVRCQFNEQGIVADASGANIPILLAECVGVERPGSNVVLGGIVS
jgi:hypothetical protein